jgi:hypothetical protein
VYLQPGGDFQKASWVNIEETFHLSITLDNISQFNDAYMERSSLLEKNLIQGCMDFTWVSGSDLTFKIHAFQKDSTSQRNEKIYEKSSNYLSEGQLARAINIQLKQSTEDISPNQINKGDMVVVKCHLRYWRNGHKKTHGLNKYLLSVKLLKQMPPQVLLKEQLDIF